MPAESNTTYLGAPFPTSANNGTNFATGISDYAGYMDTVVTNALNDALDPGVTTTGAGQVFNPAVSAAALVSCTALGAGNAYILSAAGVLVRNVIPTGAFSATPGTLPATGKYAVVGIDLVATTWGGTASVVLSTKGTDQTTAALALANPPATATSHYRLMNVVVLNTAGTYSMAANLDVRMGAIPDTRRWGVVASNGTTSQVGSNDWTVAHTATGEYTVTFNTAYAVSIAAFAQPTAAAGVTIPVLVNLATSNVEWAFYNLADALTDTAFNFFTIGR